MCEHSHNPSNFSVTQTLDEMEFDRSIHCAALNGEIDKVKRILTRDRNLASSSDPYGYTPLHYASRAGHLEICHLLIRSGADVTAVTTEGRQTPLHRAAMCGHPAVVKMLLIAGANATAQDADGETPLHKAYRSGRLSVMKEMMESAPMAMEIVDKRGRRPDELRPG